MCNYYRNLPENRKQKNYAYIRKKYIILQQKK